MRRKEGLYILESEELANSSINYLGFEGIIISSNVSIPEIIYISDGYYVGDDYLVLSLDVINMEQKAKTVESLKEILNFEMTIPLIASRYEFQVPEVAITEEISKMLNL